MTLVAQQGRPRPSDEELIAAYRASPHFAERQRRLAANAPPPAAPAQPSEIDALQALVDYLRTQPAELVARAAAAVRAELGLEQPQTAGLAANAEGLDVLPVPRGHWEAPGIPGGVAANADESGDLLPVCGFDYRR